MIGPEPVRYKNHDGVDEEPDEHAGRDDFRVRIFLLVQIPRAAYTQEPAAVPGPVEHQNNYVQHLRNNNIAYYVVDANNGNNEI